MEGRASDFMTLEHLRGASNKFRGTCSQFYVGVKVKLKNTELKTETKTFILHQDNTAEIVHHLTVTCCIGVAREGH